MLSRVIFYLKSVNFLFLFSIFDPALMVISSVGLCCIFFNSLIVIESKIGLHCLHMFQNRTSASAQAYTGLSKQKMHLVSLS